MARYRRTIEDALRDISGQARSTAGLTLSTPEMQELTGEYIAPDSIAIDHLDVVLRTDLEQNAQALADMEIAQASAVGELNQLNQDLTELSGDLTALDGTLAANKLAVDTKMAENDAALAAIPGQINQAISDANAVPISNERFTENSLTIWPFVNNAIPSGAFSPGSVTGADLADFALTVRKFKDDRHRLY